MALQRETDPKLTPETEKLDAAAQCFAAAHDEASFTTIYLAAQPRLNRFVRSLGIHPQDVDDVVSVTAMELWMQGEKFTGGFENFVTLGTVIARLRVKACRRAHARWNRARALPPGFTSVFVGPDDLSDTASPEELAMAREAFGTLTEREQEVVSSRAEGHAFQEIGDTLGLSDNQVGAIHARALERLRRVK